MEHKIFQIYIIIKQWFTKFEIFTLLRI